MRHIVLATLLLCSGAFASRGVTLQVMVDRTMFNSLPGSEAWAEALILQAAARLIPRVDSLRIGYLCGGPKTAYLAQVGRDLSPVREVLRREVLRRCTEPGSHLNAALGWAHRQGPGGLLLLTDAAVSDDPAAGELPRSGRLLDTPYAVAGARSVDREAFHRLFAGSPHYLGSYGSGPDGGEAVRVLLRRLRR